MSASIQDAKVPKFINFLIGGMSGIIAQIVTHPMDVIKIRMQVSQDSLRVAAFRTFCTNGVCGFYDGLSAALLRQLTYTTSRLGIYTTLLDIEEQHFGSLNYVTMISLGMIAGVMGSFIGTPTDLVLIRMVADMNLPPEKQRKYKNAVSGIFDIWKTEGFFALWRGAVPTMGRAAIVNGAQLGTYTRSKMLLQDAGYIQNDILLQITAALMSSVITCTASIPIDVAKTRIQNWRQPTKPPGVLTMIVNIAKKEGVMLLWRGFLPYYSRAAPNTVITMVCVDQLHKMYLKFFSKS
ncbi:Mitochondrial 2-oxoglutarate/malate carrier protein [Trachymyrmex septentrionalis]|uniref:Mitochondrial 2-oxoglutarate/malate carrier protein n=1 Tax=Trachymyrmex septentrionalis TaxID=34720 RepID=A0A195FNZ4_9HYME|nr:PREDICTED: mitochondrial 2-oxoglutarate/malate carrier protein-like [Trachymyrmex septentrionalis]KYN42136.1 Mitochondrial 2-oxoglutarate/malate carrier protein [Trachymyrmex septentrionalis]